VALSELVPDEDVPLLSALCVTDSGRDEGLPSAGFWAFCGDLGVQVGESLQRWGAR
jgi:hypothetical protein